MMVDIYKYFFKSGIGYACTITLVGIYKQPVNSQWYIIE